MVKNFWRYKPVVITGSAGFVGSHLKNYFLKAGALVYHIPYPLTDFPPLDDAYVIHLGAKTIVGEAKEDPRATFDANIKGTYDLLEACRRFNPKRIIIASTDKVYGEGLRKKETDSLNGTAPYDVSKICTDKLAQCYKDTYGMPIAITRCVNIYGPGDRHMSRLIPYTITQALADKPIELRSNGKTIRDYIYIKDVVEAYLRLGETRHTGAFNFGTGKQIDVLTLVKQIISLTNSKKKIKILNSARNEIQAQSVDSFKARTVLEWETKYSLQQGLKETIKWWKKQ